MAEEKILKVNLRKDISKAPVYDRAKRAVAAVRDFVKKHSRSDDIKIGKYLNQYIKKNGPRNPPVSYNLRIEKDEGIVKVELADAPREEKKVEKKQGLRERLLGEKAGKKAVVEKEETIEDKLEEEKKEVLKEKADENVIKKESKNKKADIKEMKESDKEKDVMTGQEAIVSKTQKPTHEKKKVKK